MYQVAQRVLFCSVMLITLLILVPFLSPKAVINSEDDPMEVTIGDGPPLKYHYKLTLITGDRLYLKRLGAKGWSVVVDPSTRPDKSVRFHWHKNNDDEYMIIPSDVIHLLKKQIDPEFFNITALIKGEMDDARMPIFSMIISGTRTDLLTQSIINKGLTATSFVTSSAIALSLKKDQLRDPSHTLFHFNKSRARFALNGATRITLNRKVFLALDHAVPAIGADIVNEQKNLKGRGINIAILDTGVDPDHRDFFFEGGRSKIAVDRDFTCYTTTNPFFCDHTPVDLNGHGTHVAGIALGTGASKNGIYQGIAPLANLLNVKVMNKRGSGLLTDILRGMEVAALGTNAIRGDEPGIEADVISMSLTSYGKEDPEDIMVKTANRLVGRYGVTVVAASGNAGNGGGFSVGSPGNAEKVITVGATTKMGPFSMAHFSSRGPTSLTYRLKPEISAPGVDMISACSLKKRLPGCLPEFPYFMASGTSMAAPVAAGAVALMIENARNRSISLTPEEIKDRLISTASLLSTKGDANRLSDVYRQGGGMIRIDKALSTPLYFSPAKINFGKHFGGSDLINKEISITNAGMEEEILTLTWRLNDAATRPYSPSTPVSFDRAMRVSPETITLPAGASRKIDVTIDLSQLPKPYVFQAYSGFIFAENTKGERIHAICALTRGTHQHTVNIKGVGLDGKPPTYAYVMAHHPESGDKYFDWAFFDDFGSLQFTLPKGSYNFVMQGDQDIEGPNGKKIHLYRVSLVEKKVDGNISEITMDTRKTAPIGFELTADPEAIKTLAQSSAYSLVRPDNSLFSMGYTILFGGLGGIRVYSDKHPTIGKPEMFYQWLKTRPRSESSKVLYDWVEIRDKEAPFEVNVTKKDLSRAGVNISEYHSENSKEGYFGSFYWAKGAHSIDSLFISGLYNMKLPLVRKEYYTPNVLGCWNELWPGKGDVFSFGAAVSTMVHGTLLPGKIFKPGEVRYESWMKRPYNPVVTSIVRDKNFLMVDGLLFRDPYGHGGWNSDGRSKFGISVRVNGDLVGYQPGFLSHLKVPLPKQNAKIEIEMKAHANPRWSHPPLKAITHIRFMTSFEATGEIVVPQTRYIASSQTINNRIITTGDLNFEVLMTQTDGTIPVLKGASVQLSTDNGMVWFDADEIEIDEDGLEVESLIPLENQGETNVSIKLTATTKGHVIIEETIQNAFILIPPR